MADHKNGMLDDLGSDDGAPEPYVPGDVISETIEIRERNGIRELPAEEKTEPEARTEGDGKPKPSEARPDGYVTKGERDRLAAERDLYRERLDKIVERFFSQQQEQSEQAPAADDDPMPDYQQDPLGWIGWRQRQDQKAEEQRADQQRQWQQQEQARQEFQDTLNRASARFQKVVQDRPEVGELYNAVRGHVAGLYKQQGYPDHQIENLVLRYEADVVRWARQEYIPIEEALEMAAQRFGVATPQRQPATAPDRDPATGQFVASDADRAAKARESQERNASLSSAPGAPVKKMTGTELAKMSEEDMWRHFESVGRKPGSKNFEREMGFR